MSSSASISPVVLPTSTSYSPLSSYLTTSSSSILACLSLMLALMYLVALSWGYRAAHENPRPLNKASGPRVQRYAPVAYVFLVLTSLVEVAISSWLVIQYGFKNIYPGDVVRNGIIFLLFASIWTFLSAGIFSLLFLHPTWSMHSISSVGTQGVWLFATWLLWVVGAGVINGSLPDLIDHGDCKGLVHCVQVRLLFAVAVVESLLLTASLAPLIWLAFWSTKS